MPCRARPTTDRRDGNPDAGRLWLAGATRLFALINQFPKCFRFPGGFVLAERQIAAEKKVIQCVFMQYSMNNDLAIPHFKIEAIIAGAVPVENTAFAFDFAKGMPSRQVGEGGFVDFEFVEKFQLGQGVELREFSGAEGVEDDLEHWCDEGDGGRIM